MSQLKTNIAIFIRPDIDITKLNQYLKSNYKNIFYITDSITINGAQHTGVIHYSDIRMKKIDILILDIKDILKIKEFQNKIIYYYRDTPDIINMKYQDYKNIVNHINTIICDESIPEQAVQDILNFNGEILNV